MDTDVAKLPSDPQTLQAMVTEQSATIASLTSQLAKLEHYVEQLLRARYGPRREGLDPSQLTLFDTTAADEQKASQPAESTIQVKEHQRRGGGRQELPEHLERVVVEHDLTAAWKEDYNHHRPHSSLGYLTPAEFAARCAASAPKLLSATPQATSPLQQHSGFTQTILS